MNPLVPAVAFDGDNEVIAGAGLLVMAALMTNEVAEDVPPPGVGLNTVICAVPALATSLIRIVAANCVLLMKTVARLEPFHWTTEALTKLVPITVSVNPMVPAVAFDGDEEVTAGTGLLVTAEFMANETAEAVPPPGVGLKTVI